MCDNVNTGKLGGGQSSRANRQVTSLCVNVLGPINHINNSILAQSKWRLLRRFPAIFNLGSRWGTCLCVYRS